jgi:hypothetical protein
MRDGESLRATSTPKQTQYGKRTRECIIHLRKRVLQTLQVTDHESRPCRPDLVLIVLVVVIVLVVPSIVAHPLSLSCAVSLTTSTRILLKHIIIVNIIVIRIANASILAPSFNLSLYVHFTCTAMHVFIPSTVMHTIDCNNCR